MNLIVRTVPEKNKSIKSSYDRIASFYDFSDSILEYLFYRKWRQRLWKAIPAGRILEIGVGTGKNIPFYPAGARISAIDMSRKMLEKAALKKDLRRDVQIELSLMDVTELQFKDGTFDSVAGSFVFMVLDDLSGALSEIKRVCKPQGKLYLLEFSRSQIRWEAILQKLLSPITRAIYQADINRDIKSILISHHFMIDRIEKGKSSDALKIIQASCAV